MRSFVSPFPDEGGQAQCNCCAKSIVLTEYIHSCIFHKGQFSFRPRTMLGTSLFMPAGEIRMQEVNYKKISVEGIKKAVQRGCMRNEITGGMRRSFDFFRKSCESNLEFVQRSSLHILLGRAQKRRVVDKLESTVQEKNYKQSEKYSLRKGRTLNRPENIRQEREEL